MPDAAPLERGDPASLGQYEVVGRLGAGGQGAVYLGRAPQGEPVAIKLLHAQMTADSAARARFAREVSAAQKVAPFCTARILEYDVHGDQPYIVSEYIDGPSLHDVVMRDGPRGAADLERLAIGTATALAAIHESGIVHRDFKPNNVLLADDGPRVVDFGIARHFDTQESAVTATGMVVGTPGYLAPEQLTGHQLGPGVDIFAWGTTMVFAATGRSPFDADSLPVIINRILNEHPDLSALPGPLRGLVERCLRKDPGRRPTAIHLLQELLAQAGAAPAGDDDALQEGTRIAAEMPAPPPIASAAFPASGTSVPSSSPMGAGARPAAASAAPAPPAQSGPAAPPITPPPMPGAAAPFPPPPGTPPPMAAPPMPGAPLGYGPSTPPPMASPLPSGPLPSGPQTPIPMHAGAPPRPPRPSRMSSGTRGPVLAAVGCSVAFLLLIIIVVALVAAGQSDDPTPTYSPAYSPSAAPTTSSTSSDPTVTLPFQGTWKGTGYQSKPRVAHWSVQITLVSGLRSGIVRYPACSGRLRVVSSSEEEIVLRQTITTGEEQCATTGYVTLSSPGNTTVRFQYAETEDAVSPNATGTLYKQ
ncbi:MAG TPA: serine/threonine-protein kinase [Streptosporangiaceae bacterium]|nr:serine/threonine-protein kinase [Streptosporangiaceae bacterium]